MEQKMITIPFEVEKAKKIQAGEEPGKIVTRAGRNVRVVCWDRHDDTYPIIALFWSEERINEVCKTYRNNGCFFKNGEENQYDLTLQVPEWTQFKDGDMIVCEIDDDENGNCRQRYSILLGKVELMDGIPCFNSYASCDYNPTQDVGKHIHYKAPFNIYSIRLAKEEEKQKFVEWLQEENTDEARYILKRFFGIEEKQECEFEPFQQVLVRDDCKRRWICALFNFYDRRKETLYPFVCIGGSFRYCIPYNEQTKHLLGTTDNWEE